MSIVITSNEPKEIKELFEDRIEIPMDFDLMADENGEVVAFKAM